MDKRDIIIDLWLEIKEKKQLVTSSTIANYIKLELKKNDLKEITELSKSIKDTVDKEYTNASLSKLDNAEQILNEQLNLINKIIRYKNTAVKDFLMVIGIFIIMLPIYYVIFIPSNEEIQNQLLERQIAKKKNKIGNIHEAWAYTQIYVENQLKSPSTAEFPFNGSKNVKHVSSGLYIFRSYVDSQNSFGATIRTYFEGNIQRIDGGWKIVTFRFIK